MTIEAKLDELIEVNKAILTALQSQAALAEPDTLEATTEQPAPARRTRKTAEQPAATPEVAADPKPQAQATPTPAAEPVTTPETPAATAPTATAQPAGASDAASAPADVPFAEVVDAIKTMNTTLNEQDPAKGRQAVLATLTKFLGTAKGKRVPDLEAAGKNAEILAFVKAQMEPAAYDLGI